MNPKSAKCLYSPRSTKFEKADSTLRSSQAVPHPSTNQALRRLTSEVRRDPVHSTRYGRRRGARGTSGRPQGAFGSFGLVFGVGASLLQCREVPKGPVLAVRHAVFTVAILAQGTRRADALTQAFSQLRGAPFAATAWSAVRRDGAERRVPLKLLWPRYILGEH